MEFLDFKNLLNKSIEKFQQEEESLFSIYQASLQEETISHHLACKMGVIFGNYNVDCEYNRQPGGDKKQDDQSANRRPDIIIHKRGNNDSNLALIEVKWDGNRSNDSIKITSFSNLRYAYGVAVRFDKDGKTASIIIYNYKALAKENYELKT